MTRKSTPSLPPVSEDVAAEAAKRKYLGKLYPHASSDMIQAIMTQSDEAEIVDPGLIEAMDTARQQARESLQSFEIALEQVKILLSDASKISSNTNEIEKLIPPLKEAPGETRNALQEVVAAAFLNAALYNPATVQNLILLFGPSEEGGKPLVDFTQPIAEAKKMGIDLELDVEGAPETMR